MSRDALALRAARLFHEHYERLAPAHGYSTRHETRVPWNDLPEALRRLTVATARAVLDDLAPHIEALEAVAEGARVLQAQALDGPTVEKYVTCRGLDDALVRLDAFHAAVRKTAEAIIAERRGEPCCQACDRGGAHHVALHFVQAPGLPRLHVDDPG